MAVHSRLHPLVQRLIQREDIEQRTPKWFAMRGKMLTASQVASVIGWDKYKSADSLLREKLTIDRSNSGGSFATNWGNQYEDEAISEYEKLTGFRVLRFG
jgi:predicted phage-related endonuclease